MTTLEIPETIQDKIQNKGLVLFDGECGFCQSSVRFILQHDSEAFFLFAPLQSEWLSETLPEEYKNLSTLLLIENAKLYDRSTAALKIARRLNSPAKFLSPFRLLPRGLRDWGYDRIADNRHLLRGPNQCELLSEEEKERFL